MRKEKVFVFMAAAALTLILSVSAAAHTPEETSAGLKEIPIQEGPAVLPQGPLILPPV